MGSEVDVNLAKVGSGKVQIYAPYF